MSQGRHISSAVKKIVAGVVAENQKATREELLPIIRARVASAHKPEPADSTLLKLISRYRNQPMPDQDQPWTLASLRGHPVPPECLPTLMQVWRFALHLDEPLTVRQAYWAAHLYPLFPNPLYLWMWAYAAAIGERSAELVGEPLDSAALDIIASRCSGWEQRTLALTDAPLNLVGSHVPLFSYVSPGGSASLEELAARGQPHGASADEAGFFDYELELRLEQLPPVDSTGLTFQAQMVYLRWLVYLCKGPNWRTLSPDQALDLVVRLRQWVVRQQTRILAVQRAVVGDQVAASDHATESDLSAIAGECPQDLLELVGYPADHAEQHWGYAVFSNRDHPYLDPE